MRGDWKEIQVILQPCLLLGPNEKYKMLMQEKLIDKTTTETCLALTIQHRLERKQQLLTKVHHTAPLRTSNMDTASVEQQVPDHNIIKEDMPLITRESNIAMTSLSLN